MRTSYQLSARLLIAACLPTVFAWGPGGGGNWGQPPPGGQWPGQSPTTPPVGGVTPASVTPASVAPASVAPVSVAPVSPPPTTPTVAPVGGGTTVPGAGSSAGGASVSQASQSATPNSCGSNAQKISLQNNSAKELVIQAGPPWTVGNCGNIAAGSSCTFCQTRGSTGGNLQVGYGVANSLGTWIEGEWNTDALPTIDISFIPGYSVPISCTSDSTGSSKGWSTPLCTDSSCSNCAGDGVKWDGNACENPAGASNPNAGSLTNGPCPSFFASSQGGAYCYPNDNGVVGYGDGWDSVSCTAGPQYGSGSASKREEGSSFFPRDAQEENATLEARDSDMARRHAGAAALGIHGGARSHARSLKYLVS